MKKRLIQFFCIVFLLCGSPPFIYGAFKEIWKGKFDNRIEKLLTIDLNKNGTKEILILSGYKKLRLFQWDRKTFVKRWEAPNLKDGIDFEYYNFNNFLLVKQYDPKDRTITPYALFYKDGNYVLEEIKESRIPSWPDESYVTSGSFKNKDSKDLIITTYCKDRKCYLRFRDVRDTNDILWTSYFSIAWKADLPLLNALPVFGNFRGNKEIELLVIPYNEEKGYLISQILKSFMVREIISHRKTEDNKTLPLFPLFTRSNEKNYRVGHSTSKNFDEIFFIEPSEPFNFGTLYKSIWNKDRFDFQEILDRGLIGYDNLNLSDIDNDGLDEIILSKIRGDLIGMEEEPSITERRDEINILKWNSKEKEYKKIWTSQSLSAITQILVDDVTGDGKKEIVVGNDKGEIHIFGQKQFYKKDSNEKNTYMLDFLFPHL